MALSERALLLQLQEEAQIVSDLTYPYGDPNNPLSIESVFNEFADFDAGKVLREIRTDMKTFERFLEDEKQVLARILIYYPDGTLNFQASLQWVSSEYPEYVGTFVYVFERILDTIKEDYPTLRQLYLEGDLTKYEFDNITTAIFYEEESRAVLESFKSALPVNPIKDDPTLVATNAPVGDVKLNIYKTEVDSLYRTYLGRAADPDGLEYWSTLLNSGIINIGELQQRLYDSSEAITYRAQFGDTQFEDAVTGYYRTLLGRDPDQGGLNYYLARLKLGQATLEVIANEIGGSVEGQAYSAQKELKEWAEAVEDTLTDHEKFEKMTLDDLSLHFASLKKIIGNPLTDKITINGSSPLRDVAVAIANVEEYANNISAAYGKYRSIVETIQGLVFLETDTEYDRNQVRKEIAASLFSNKNSDGQYIITSDDEKVMKQYFPGLELAVSSYVNRGLIDPDFFTKGVNQFWLAPEKRKPWVGSLNPTLEQLIEGRIADYILLNGSVPEDVADTIQQYSLEEWKSQQQNTREGSVKGLVDVTSLTSLESYVYANPDRLIQDDQGRWVVYGVGDLNNPFPNTKYNNDGVLCYDDGQPVNVTVFRAPGGILNNIQIRVIPEIPQTTSQLITGIISETAQVEQPGLFSAEVILEKMIEKGVDLQSFYTLATDNQNPPTSQQLLDTINLAQIVNADGTVNIIETVKNLKLLIGGTTNGETIINDFYDIYEGQINEATSLTSGQRTSLDTTEQRQVSAVITNADEIRSSLTGLKTAEQTSQVSNLTSLTQVNDTFGANQFDRVISSLNNPLYRAQQNANILQLDRVEVQPGQSVNLAYSTVNPDYGPNFTGTTYVAVVKQLQGYRTVNVSDNLVTPARQNFFFTGPPVNFTITIKSGTPVGFQFYIEVAYPTTQYGDIPLVNSKLITVI
jgi:hypothetical protein